MNPAEGVSAEDMITEVPTGSNYRLIDNWGSVLIQDLDDFQDALRVNYDPSVTDNYITWDIDAAKEITRERLRNERKTLFEANDIKLRDAILANNDGDIAKFTAERDRLRDAPLLADSANTLEELRNITL